MMSTVALPTSTGLSNPWAITISTPAKVGNESVGTCFPVAFHGIFFTPLAALLTHTTWHVGTRCTPEDETASNIGITMLVALHHDTCLVVDAQCGQHATLW